MIPAPDAVAPTDARPGLSEVRALLGASTPAALHRIPDELVDLAATLRDARRRQAGALAQAGERALGQIPRLLRGPVRKIVGG